MLPVTFFGEKTARLLLWGRETHEARSRPLEVTSSTQGVQIRDEGAPWRPRGQGLGRRSSETGLNAGGS